VELNELSGRDLRTLFARRTVSLLLRRRREKGHVCLYSTDEISHLITQKERWLLKLTVICGKNNEE